MPPDIQSFLNLLRKSKGYFKPTQNVRARDVIRELPGAAKEFAQSIPRSAVQLQLETQKRFNALPGQRGQMPTTFTPGRGVAPRLEKALLGNKKIVPASEQGREDLQSFGASKKRADQFGTSFGIAMAALDIIPGGRGKAAKTIAQTPELIRASRHIAERVGRNKPQVFGGAVKQIRGFLPLLKRNLLDSFAPIEDFITHVEKKGLTVNGVKTMLSITEDPRFLRNRVIGANGIAGEMIKQGLGPILKKVGVNSLDEFNRYLIARHDLDVIKAGHKTGVDPNEAKLFTQKLEPFYGDLGREVNKYTQGLLNYVTEGGLISKNLRDELIRKYPNYVPMNRIIEELDDISPTLTSKRGVASISSQSVVQRMKGSDLHIENPLESLLDKTMRAAQQVEINRTARALVNLRKFDEFKELITPVAHGPIENTISILENGEKLTYYVQKEIAKAAKNLSKEDIDIVARIFAMPVRTLRLGATGIYPPFIASNLVRDQFFAAVTSSKAAKTSILNPYNFTAALADTVGRRGSFQDFLAAGGGSSNFFQQVRKAPKVTIQSLARTPAGKVTKTIIDPRGWLAAFEDLVSLGEQTTRTQQFRGIRKALGGAGRVDPFAAPDAATLEALKAGRENTVDFGKAGNWGVVLNAAWVYLNAGIQGSRTTLRALKQHPLATTFKITTTLYLPMIYITRWNMATPERRKAYMDIREHEKNTSFIILPPNPKKDEQGNYVHAFKVPLPQGFGALTIPIRKYIEWVSDKENINLKESIGGATLDTVSGLSPVDISSPGQAASRLTPTAILPFIEGLTNTKLFSNTKIVPRGQEDLPASEQSRYDTAAIAKIVGKKLNVSPPILQNFVTSYSGGTGSALLNVIDRAMAKVGLIKEEDIGGRGIIEDIQYRFSRARVGEGEEKQWLEKKNTREEQAVRVKKEREAADLIYEELKNNYPENDWKGRMSELKNTGVLNERIYNRIKRMYEDDKRGLTDQERDLKYNTAVPERAKIILGKLNEMPDDQQRQYLKELKSKKVLTERTYEELVSLGYSLP